MLISRISSLCLSVANIFVLNCDCVVVLSMGLIKFDSVSLNFSANMHIQTAMMYEPVIQRQSKWNQKSSQLGRSSPQEPLFLHYVSFRAANFKILSKGEPHVQLASLWEQVTEFTKMCLLCIRMMP